MRVKNLLCLVLLSACLLSSTCRSVLAEELSEFQLSATPFSEEVSSRRSSAARSFSVRLPSENRPTEFVEYQRKERRISVLDSNGQVTGERSFTIVRASDFQEKFGVFSFANDRTKPSLSASLYEQSQDDVRNWSISSARNSERRTARTHRVVGLSAEDLKHDFSCGLGEVPEQLQPPAPAVLRSNKEETPRAPAVRKVIQLVVVSSGDFTDGRSDDEVIAQAVSTVAAANLYFEPLSLEIDLVGVQIFKKGAGDPYEVATVASDSLEMLMKVKSEWQGRSHPEHDVVALLAKSRFANAVGQAFPATSCLIPDYSVFFATQAGDTEAARVNLAATFAHELGHNIGMRHDGVRYPEGPSLMWPSFLRFLPWGFSQTSIEEWLSHARRGGDACFREVAAPPGSGTPSGPTTGLEIHFENGPEQQATVREGEVLVYQLRIRGHAAGVSYQAFDLPDGASFDQFTGTLRYVPNHSVTNRAEGAKSFKIRVVASSATKSATAILTLNVGDANRPPEFFGAMSQAQEAEVGYLFELPVQAFDLDEFDSVSVGFLNAGAFRGFTSPPNVLTSGSGALIRWTPSADAIGLHRFLFVATDSSGASVQRVVAVRVLPANSPPLIEVPEKIVRSSAELFELQVRATDPEGAAVRLSFSNLPGGSLVTFAPGLAEIQYAGAPTSGAQFVFEVRASDGRKETRKTITVELTPSSTSRAVLGVRWPGTSRRRSASTTAQSESPVALYDALSGMWSFTDCEGVLQSERQFGGFLGDHPFQYERAGRKYPAIYRVVNGQGHWLSKDERGIISDIAWGLARDVPVPGDFDRDGETDAALFRLSDRKWYVRFSSGFESQVLDDAKFALAPQSVVHPFAADIDGDGYDDRVILETRIGENAVFHVWLATGVRHAFVVEGSGDSQYRLPLVSDFDGDGRSDFALGTNDGMTRKFVSDTGVLFQQAASGSGSLLTSAYCEPTTARALRVKADNVSQVTPDVAQLRRTAGLQRNTFGDTDGDGASNIAVWRRDASGHAGQWYERKKLALSGAYSRIPSGFGYPVAGNFAGSSGGTLSFFANGLWTDQQESGEVVQSLWGENGDIPIVGDYNGDGRDDRAIFRAADSSWWILFQTEAGLSAKVLHWGERGDVPVPADYNGDGRTDIAVWRPSTGQWFIIEETGGVRIEVFGNPQDIPMPADYDGDGRAELAIWRPANATWHIKRGSDANSILSVQWGFSSDNPVRGDFDGNGRDDLAVFRPESATWHILHLDSLGNRSQHIQFGLPTDSPLGGARQIRVF